MTKQSQSMGWLSHTGHIHTEHYCPCTYRSHTKHYCPCLGVSVTGPQSSQGVSGMAGTDPMPVKEALRSERFKSVKLMVFPSL